MPRKEILLKNAVKPSAKNSSSTLDDTDAVQKDSHDKASKKSDFKYEHKKNEKQTSSLASQLDQLNLNSVESSIAWCKSLDLMFWKGNKNKSEISGYQVHSQLKSDGNAIINPLRTKVELDATGDPTLNFLMVNVGFKLSQSDKKGNTFVTFPIRVNAQNYFSMRNSWRFGEGAGKDQVKIDNGKSKSYKAPTRSHDSGKRVNRRHSKGKESTLSIQVFTKVQENGPLHYLTQSSPLYEQKFHHSEQALFEYLSRGSTIEYLARRLCDAGVPRGTQVLAIIIDMHSTRYVCENCELNLLGLMSPDYIFLKNMAKIFSKPKYSFIVQNICVAPRVSANKPDGKNKKLTEADHNAPEQSKLIGKLPSTIANKIIYESDCDVYKLSEITTDLHIRTVFVSSDVSGNDKKIYHETYNKLVNIEYAQMIAAGFYLKYNNINNMPDIYMQNEESNQPEKFEVEFTELALLHAKINYENFESLANEVNKARSKYESEMRVEENLFKLSELKISKRKLDKLSDNYLLAISDFLMEALKDGIIDFEEIENLSIDIIRVISKPNIIDLIDSNSVSIKEIIECYEEEIIHLLDRSNVIDLIETGLVSIKEIIKCYKKDSENTTNVLKFDIYSGLAADHKLNLDKVIKLYKEHPDHIRCLSENIDDILFEQAPHVSPIVLEYATDLDINDAREELRRYPDILKSFEKNLLKLGIKLQELDSESESKSKSKSDQELSSDQENSEANDDNNSSNDESDNSNNSDVSGDSSNNDSIDEKPRLFRRN